MATAIKTYDKQIKSVRRRADLVQAGNFILATRDSGYRSPAYALAELIDNADTGRGQPDRGFRRGYGSTAMALGDNRRR